jgi:hypothetical protein
MPPGVINPEIAAAFAVAPVMASNSPIVPMPSFATNSF